MGNGLSAIYDLLRGSLCSLTAVGDSVPKPLRFIRSEISDGRYEKQQLVCCCLPHLYDRRIVAYKIGESNNNELVYEAVDLNPDAHPLFHSDRGFQYTSKAFRQKLVNAGMRQSMSRVGRCIDNGPMEGYWGILKSEMYYLRKFTSKVELTEAIEAYIAYYNTKRYQFRLHCMTPMEYHKAYAA